MSEDERNEASGGANATEKVGDVRKTRGIRFPESEWEEVKRAALAHDKPAAEFVRERILALARNPEGADRVPKSVDPAPVAGPMAPLIERIFRYTWFLATERRDAMAREGRGDELDKLVAEARSFQDALRRGTADRAKSAPAHADSGQRPPESRACRACIGRRQRTPFS